MKNMKNLLLMSCLIFCLASCQDWLTIQPETQVTKEDMFKTQGGFYDALIGCYTLMRDNYSPDASMVVGGVEYMANLWITATDGGTAYDFASHDYRADLVEMNLSQLFLKQYEIIANVNTLLEYIDIQNNVLTEDEEDLYKGEALGLRAFIHFDLIRLWGPMPTGIDGNRDYLPYVTTVQLENYPYSNYQEYMTQLCTDLDSAELLLQRVDLIVANDKSVSYRQNRMNYYAVLGLQARVHLWLGEHDEALRYARLVKEATVAGEKKQFALGVENDFLRYDRVLYSCEQLFGISLEEFNDNMIADGSYAAFEQKSTNLSELYAAEDIRFRYLWYTDDGGGLRSSNKYGNMASFDTENPAPTKSVPLIRLSEMYLIIAECAGLTEANMVYTEFLASRGLTTTELTENNRQEIILQEYLKEFYAEGQMFFVYKRLGTVNMRWSSRMCGEDVYVLPLPLRELSTTENY